MPTLTATLRAGKQVTGRRRPLAAFLGRLFEQLDACGVRYCVLHGYDDLPESAASDIDMALHPADLPALARVFQVLREDGFVPVQEIDYDVHCRYFVFAWVDGPTVRTIAVDVTTQHRQDHFILQSGEELVEGRRRHSTFWIPSAPAEFVYLLAKKVVKTSAPEHQVRHLRDLARELGTDQARTAAGRLFGTAWQERVVAWCLDESLPSQLQALRRQFGLTITKREPLNVARYLLSDLPRKARRWRQPVGVFVTVLGPDGVGKSTLIASLEEQLAGAFRGVRRYHWRPMWLAGKRNDSPTSGPHGREAHSWLRSVVRTGVHLLDYIVGYHAQVRPALVRSTLVVFDRYAGDMLVDPARYRYGGPRVLLRLLESLAPTPDLQLVLDAPADLVEARKAEVSAGELRRQRHAFLDLATRRSEAVVIDASRSAAEVAREAALAIVERLGRRFELRHPEWSVASQPQIPPAVPEPLAPWLSVRACSPDVTDGQPSVALPSAGHMRWLVPSAGPGATRQALSIYTPYAPTARLLKKPAEWALGAAPFDALPASMRVSATLEPPVRALVERVLGESAPLFSVCMSAPGRYRKATVQVQRADGSVAAYLKLPLTDAAATRLRHEADVLTVLGQHDRVAPLVPQVLHAGVCEAGFALVVSPLAGRRGPSRFTPDHVRFLGALADVARVHRPGADVADDVTSEWERVAGQMPTSVRDLVARALEGARRDLHGIDLPCGLAHGDFAPWNTRVAEPGLAVFDWDRAEYDTPVWWDVFHFETQVGSLLGRRARSGFRCDEHPGSHGAFVLYQVRAIADALLEDPEQPRGLTFRTTMLARYDTPATWHQTGLPC